MQPFLIQIDDMYYVINGTDLLTDEYVSDATG